MCYLAQVWWCAGRRWSSCICEVCNMCTCMWREAREVPRGSGRTDPPLPSTYLIQFALQQCGDFLITFRVPFFPFTLRATRPSTGQKNTADPKIGQKQAKTVRKNRIWAPFGLVFGHFQDDWNWESVGGRRVLNFYLLPTPVHASNWYRTRRQAPKGQMFHFPPLPHPRRLRQLSSPPPTEKRKNPCMLLSHTLACLAGSLWSPLGAYTPWKP